MIVYKDYILKDIAKTITGPFGSQLHASDYVKDGTPMVTVEHLGVESFSHDNLPKVSIEDRDRLSKYILNKGDIVFSRVGSIDRCTIVREQEAGWMFSGRCLRVRVNEKADYRYVNFYFRLKAFKKMMLNISVGATMPSLNTKLMDGIKLKLPSLNYQKTVSDILEKIDNKILLNNRLNTELESMAKLIYDYWFVQFDFPISKAQAEAMGKPELEGKPYKKSGGNMVFHEELKRKVPERWGAGSLNDLGTIIGGSTPSKAVDEYFCKGFGVSWITPKDLSLNKGKKFITRGEIDVTIKGLKSASLKIMPKGTVLLSSRAPIGYLAISRKGVTTNQGFKSIVPNKNHSTEFIFYTISNLIPLIERNAVGSTFKEVSGSTLKAIQTILPERDLLNKFDLKVKGIFNQQNIIELQNEELTSLRDWLLPMLMNGQVKVREGASDKAKHYDIGASELKIAAEGKEGYGVLPLNIPDSKKGFAKQVLAGKIIQECKDNNGFTNIKLQKMMHLAEHLMEAELNLNYYNQAAGPFDNKFMHVFKNQMEKQKWFEKVGNQYRSLENGHKIDGYFNNYFTPRKEKFDKLIHLLGNASEDQCEIISTLYAVWNDRIIKVEPISDNLLIEDFFNWSERKHKYEEPQLLKALGWMRRNGIIPKGFGELIKHRKK